MSHTLRVLRVPIQVDESWEKAHVSFLLFYRGRFLLLSNGSFYLMFVLLTMENRMKVPFVDVGAINLALYCLKKKKKVRYVRYWATNVYISLQE